MIKMIFDESDWVDDKDNKITLEVPLKKVVTTMIKTMKNIASGKDNNPARLYASNVYTSLVLLSNALDEECGWLESEGILNVKDLPGARKERKNNKSIILETTIVALMSKWDKWTGTHSQLLHVLKDFVTVKEQRIQEWPKSPNSLSNKIVPLIPSLRKKGIEVWRGKSGGERIITLECTTIG